MSLGLLATTLEHYDAADAHFSEAHATHERIGAPYLLAVTRVEWAKMLLRRSRPGDRDRARALLDQALATAREYGFGGVESQITWLLETCAVTPTQWSTCHHDNPPDAKFLRS